MVIAASDELRHEQSDDPSFRESLYFNFYDPKTRVAAWIYIWLTPNKERKAGMLVSFYRGRWLDKRMGEIAMSAPGHGIQRGHDSICFFTYESKSPLRGDFDDATIAGLRIRRIEPLKRYELSYDDGEETSFVLDGEFITLPYDYAGGVNRTPAAVAANRYHRPWWVRGWLQLNGGRMVLNCTGDTDHSWGKRDWASLFRDNHYSFKYWAFQAVDGRASISVIQQGLRGVETVLGFVAIDGTVASASAIDVSQAYDCEGLQEDIKLVVTDALGRKVRAAFEKVESCVALGEDSFWCFEGFGRYDVEGFGSASGLVSYAWPAAISAQQLHSGDMTR